MRLHTKWLLALFFMCLACLSSGAVFAQGNVSPTPIPIQLSTATPLPLIGEPTATPTTEATETPNIVMLKAKDSAGEVNVRLDADPDADIAGIIVPGEQFPVTGRFFLWYQLRFDNSPTGRAWVFGELVDIIGDPALIPDLSEEPEATTDATIIGATQTWEAITLTPGGIFTATANARILVDPVSVDAAEGSEAAGLSGLNPAVGQGETPIAQNRPPTFTPPPRFSQPSDADESTEGTLPTPALQTVNSGSASEIAPVVPILVLGGLGILGLFISFLRR